MNETDKHRRKWPAVHATCSRLLPTRTKPRWKISKRPSKPLQASTSSSWAARPSIDSRRFLPIVSLLIFPALTTEMYLEYLHSPYNGISLWRPAQISFRGPISPHLSRSSSAEESPQVPMRLNTHRPERAACKYTPRSDNTL